MKKILSILLCAVMLLSLLAGCGGGEPEPTEATKHSHTYASQWSHNETSHWYQATCEHATLQANLGDHVDEDLDGVCDICSYEDASCQHTYSDVWTSDAESHWHAATCNHIGKVAELAAHSDSDNDGACDVCGYMGDHTHTYEEAWTNDNAQHWRKATCGHDVVSEMAAHADSDNDGTCDVCGWFEESHTHTFSEDWKTDVTYHWHAATCEHLGAFSDRAQHADGDEDGHCDTCGYLMCTHEDLDLDGECDTCGWVDPEHTHTFGEEMGSNVNGHWSIASCHPGATSALEEHVDSDNNGVCDVCAFQICGHSYAATWTTDETHHWHAILCTCSIARKDYGQHVDADGDGGCDICLYGIPVEAVFEVLLEDEAFVLVETGMISFVPVTIYFPQPGRYVITPSNAEVRVWLTDGSDANTDHAFFNTESPLTVDVEQAGEMTLYFRYFDFDYQVGKEVPFTYTVIRADDLVIETMQGKVELPANTLYTVKFIAHELGTYKLITSVDGLVIGLSEDTMEYYKGHVELNVTKVGEEFTFYIRYDDPEVHSFVFDWRLDPPFSLPVGVGNYAVDVDPKRIDYKIEFTAPEAGYYLLSVSNEWLTFCRWGEEFNEPVRLEVTQVLTPYMEAGEVFTTWLETVYDYPASTNVYDTLTVTNVGMKLEEVVNTVTPGAAGSRFCFQALQSGYYRITVTGGELGILAADESVTWITNAYEVNLEMDYTYSFLVRGAGSVQVQIEPVIYALQLMDGDNTVYMEPNRYYDVTFLYNSVSGVVDMDMNSNIALTWEGNLYVYVNGVEYTQGGTIELLNTRVQILVKSNGGTDVNIKVTMIYDANDQEVQGASHADLVVNQTAILAVNRDGVGATASFTAEVGGSYTLTAYDAKVLVYVVAPNGTQTQVLVGNGTYSFRLNAGATINFFIQTNDESVASISLVVTAGR